MMKTGKMFQRRFDELSQQLEEIESSKFQRRMSRVLNMDFVDTELFTKWRVKARSLILNVCGQESEYYQGLKKTEDASDFRDTFGLFRKQRAIFVAAKEDFEGGYLTSLKALVQADVLEDELEQAEELLRSNYMTAAAVIAGVVLETAIRELSERHGVVVGKLDKMNADLTKKTVYSKLVQKQITVLADIRNNAAHGNSGAFTKTDVENMVRDVRNLLATHFV